MIYVQVFGMMNTHLIGFVKDRAQNLLMLACTLMLRETDSFPQSNWLRLF